jgi:hypothetical protein
MVASDSEIAHRYSRSFFPIYISEAFVDFGTMRSGCTNYPGFDWAEE